MKYLGGGARSGFQELGRDLGAEEAAEPVRFQIIAFQFFSHGVQSWYVVASIQQRGSKSCSAVSQDGRDLVSIGK